VGKNAKLDIAESFFMNNSCSINCLEKIEIGENTLFGESVKLYDHNHQYSKEKIEHKKFNTSPIKIGNNCWLGSNVIVLKGVEIGNNCVIGAGCIIYKNIPAGSVVINNQELMIKNQKE
jgi:acetyltransferase-like isoleucine patch superfamily enzyme